MESNYKHSEVAFILKKAYVKDGGSILNDVIYSDFLNVLASSAYDELEAFFNSSINEEVTRLEEEVDALAGALKIQQGKIEVEVPNQLSMFETNEYYVKLDKRFDKLLNILNAQANASLM